MFEPFDFYTISAVASGIACLIAISPVIALKIWFRD